MDLNEMIKGCEKVIEKQKLLYKLCHGTNKGSIKIAEEHAQIAEWLKELKQRREHVGYWQKHEGNHSTYYDCSLCGCLAPCTETADSFIWKLSDYCPDCGAKMEREEELMYHISPGNHVPAFVIKNEEEPKEEIMPLSRLELNGQGLFMTVHELKLTESDRFFDDAEHCKPKEEYHDFISILQDFDEEMPMPEINDFLENGKFFFTEKALKKFSSQIADLKHIFETLFPELDFKIINKEVMSNDCRIVYRDPYQIFFDDTPAHCRSENEKGVEK
jgi:hypothetical protein